jgi:hypothetical protein
MIGEKASDMIKNTWKGSWLTSDWITLKIFNFNLSSH